MQDTHENTVEYYEWEDLPCRIIRDETYAQRAEIYVPGEGFSPTSPANVMFHGCRISERRFKRMVMENTGFKPQGEQP